MKENDIAGSDLDCYRCWTLLEMACMERDLWQRVRVRA